ncbi:unnamed protein product [Umbelopsis vinacea]
MDFPFFYEDGLGKIVNKNGVDPMDVESDNEGEDVQVETLISLNSYLDNQRQQQKQNEEQQQQQQQREQQNNDKKNGPDPTLGEQHKAFLVNYVDENPLAVVDQVMESLIQEFEGLSVKKTAVHRFMKEECQLTFKKTQFHALKRNEGQTINKRYEWVIKYTTMTDMDF